MPPTHIPLTPMQGNTPCCGVSTSIEDYFLTRRKFLNRVGMGLGALSLATLFDPAELFSGAEPDGFSPSSNPLAPRAPPLPATAKAVIHIFAQGAPSHIDTWDPKPELVRMDGRPIGDSGVAMGSPFRFTPMGRSGTQVSELFPGIGQHVDDMAGVIRSMYTDIPAHEVATVFMNTAGSLRITKPSMGSWVVDGLGTQNQNLPGFISLRNGGAAVGRRGELRLGLPSGRLPGLERQHPGGDGAADDPEHPQPLHRRGRAAPPDGSRRRGSRFRRARLRADLRLSEPRRPTISPVIQAEEPPPPLPEYELRRPRRATSGRPATGLEHL